MIKTLRKAIIKWYKLWNKFKKKRSSENWQSYKWQCNICLNILKSTKITFFETLNINKINGNKKFWKTVNPFFTDKCKTTNNIILTEQWNSQWQPKNFQYFSRVFYKCYLSLPELTWNMNFENEETCKKIKETFCNETSFFVTISNKDVLELIKQFPEKKNNCFKWHPSLSTYLCLLWKIN